MVIISYGGVLRIGVACDKIINGSVAEWLKAHDSKSCRRATVSRVQIPPLPPENSVRHPRGGCFLSTGV